jgi:transposase InsO family protein
MSKSKVIVLSVVVQGLSKAEAARRHGVSWRWVHELVTRDQEGGLEAVEPRSTRPRGNSRATPPDLRARILQLRTDLTSQGLDAGPATIAFHLAAENQPVPSTSTIRRILHAAGLITPEPKKRPRSSLRRFAADQPNECWQSDFTHWALADGTDTEILSWLDDHSRCALSITAHRRVTGDIVIDTFATAIVQHGAPASTLTDNGSVFTARFTGGRNGFEHLLASLGITQKNGHPAHPQTQGKIERFQQTLKKWLTVQPRAATLTGLQAQLDAFADLYNHHRPHRALHGTTPAAAYAAGVKATPSRSPCDGHWRVRHDRVDKGGKISLRRAGRMHHLSAGAAHRGSPVLLIIDTREVTVVHLATGEILSRHDIDPTRGYWPNKDKEPGRWPGSPSER